LENYLLLFLGILNTGLICFVFARKNKEQQLQQDMEKNFLRLENNLREEFYRNRTELASSLKDQSGILKSHYMELRSELDRFFENSNKIHQEKFQMIHLSQEKLIQGTEKKLNEMRETVDEKLQKTLHERIGQSFEIVGKQLQAVQEGLGEMKSIASDVGGLKKVLGNVKLRGGIGEVQLSLLLEQILAPEQYEANVKTKKGSSDLVEFAIKLPGKEEGLDTIWLPIDAKFPKDYYDQLVEAHEKGELSQIEEAQKNLENAVKKMAKDISEKYLDVPYTTDFAIMFLPFEGIYAEVIRKSSLIHDLQKNYKIIVTGPTTLAAILNSLQMGFRTLAIQKRSSEVWRILGAVKTEFDKFGGLIEKVQKNIQTGLNDLDQLVGVRSNAIRRKLKSVETVSLRESDLLLEESISYDGDQKL